jgi:hypothetical protein
MSGPTSSPPVVYNYLTYSLRSTLDGLFHLLARISSYEASLIDQRRSILASRSLALVDNTLLVLELPSLTKPIDIWYGATVSRNAAFHFLRSENPGKLNFRFITYKFKSMQNSRSNICIQCCLHIFLSRKSYLRKFKALDLP